jgi:hypothetical protein
MFNAKATDAWHTGTRLVRGSITKIVSQSWGACRSLSTSRIDYDVKKPGIRTTLIDGNNVTYKILAYRKLTRTEVAQTVNLYLRETSLRKRPKPGDVVTLVTVAGILPRLL